MEQCTNVTGGLGTPVRADLRVMNSDIELVCFGRGAHRRLERAQRWLRGFEKRFSRFNALSELNRLNRAAGKPFGASPALFHLVQIALEFADRSGGAFDPTIVRRLESAGYDRSFELLTPIATETIGRRLPQPRLRRWLRKDRSAFDPTLTRIGVAPIPRFLELMRPSWRDVRLDFASRAVTMPAGEGIDLGGIGKGYAVDRVAAILGTPCLVNGGGDVFASGRPNDSSAWLIAVEDPYAPENDLMLLAAVDRGVATSSTLRRRWPRGGRQLHHLIDPQTGEPSQADAVQVTVVAASALLADYHAKVALLLGATGGLAYINREPDVEGLIVHRNGSLLESKGLSRYAAQLPTL